MTVTSALRELLAALRACHEAQAHLIEDKQTWAVISLWLDEWPSIPEWTSHAQRLHAALVAAERAAEGGE